MKKNIIVKVVRQIRSKFISRARPELVEGCLRAHFENLHIFKIIKNPEKSARRYPSTGSGRARREYIVSGLVSDSCYIFIRAFIFSTIFTATHLFADQHISFKLGIENASALLLQTICSAEDAK